MAQAEKQQLEDDAEAVNTFRHALHDAEAARTIAISAANRDYENIAGPLTRAREAALAGAYAGAVARWAATCGDDPTGALEAALARAVADRVQAIAGIDNGYWQIWHNASHEMVAATAPAQAAANSLIADADLAWVITMAPQQQTAWNRFTDAALGEVQSLAAVAVATNLTLIDNAAAWVGAVSGLTQVKLDAESQAGLDYVNTLAPQLRGQYDAISSAGLGHDLAMIPVAKQTNDDLADNAAAEAEAAIDATKDYSDAEDDAAKDWVDAVAPAEQQKHDAISTNQLNHVQQVNQAAQELVETQVNNLRNWFAAALSAATHKEKAVADNAQLSANAFASALIGFGTAVATALNNWSAGATSAVSAVAASNQTSQAPALPEGISEINAHEEALRDELAKLIKAKHDLMWANGALMTERDSWLYYFYHIKVVDTTVAIISISKTLFSAIRSYGATRAVHAAQSAYRWGATRAANHELAQRTAVEALERQAISGLKTDAVTTGLMSALTITPERAQQNTINYFDGLIDINQRQVQIMGERINEIRALLEQMEE